MNYVDLYQRAVPQYGYAPRPQPLTSDIANAQAAGDFRHNMKQLDRAGLSRGAGQRQQAGIQAAKSLSDGIAEAYTRQATDNAQYTNAAMQAAEGQEQFAQALGALQQQNAYANAMASMQRMNALKGLLG